MSSINTTIRTFVALELPGEVKAALSETSHKLSAELGPSARAVRWARPEAIHLTLQFLGEVPARMQHLIKEAIVRGCMGQGPIDLALGGLGVFPNLKRPRVVWVGLKGDDANIQALRSLQSAVSHELSEIGFKPDKVFSPHLTLGRVREQATHEEIEGIGIVVARATDQPIVTCAFRLNEVNLMRSDLRPSGSVYTKLATVLLSEGI